MTDTYIIVVEREVAPSVVLGTWTDEAEATKAMNEDPTIEMLVSDDCIDCFILRVEDISTYRDREV